LVPVFVFGEAATLVEPFFSSLLLFDITDRHLTHTEQTMLRGLSSSLAPRVFGGSCGAISAAARRHAATSALFGSTRKLLCPTGPNKNAASTTASAAAPQQKGGSVDASPDTHPDFAPRPVQTDSLKEERTQIMDDIADTIKTEDVVIFIKGLPETPVCGFSKKMVDIVDALALEYTSFDVLAHPIVRSYVKELSQWPTVPQLFIKGEFVGGNDVVQEMAKNGQLQELLKKHKIEHRDFKF
jgi:monothiol glutaredoxin